MHMANQSELKKLALKYFAGGLPTDKEKVLFDFINESPENLAQFREWENVWITAAQDDESINAEWDNFLKEKKLFEKPVKVRKFMTVTNVKELFQEKL